MYEELPGVFFTAPLHFQYSNDVTSATMFYIDFFLQKVVLFRWNSFFILVLKIRRKKIKKKKHPVHHQDSVMMKVKFGDKL